MKGCSQEREQHLRRSEMFEKSLWNIDANSNQLELKRRKWWTRMNILTLKRHFWSVLINISVSLRMHQSESSCKIYPVATRLGPSSSDVTLGRLRCSSTFDVNFASSSWIRNGTAIERKYIQENKEKIWTAVSFVNFSTAEDGETFECQISYPNNGGTSKCHVTLGM